MDFPFTIADVCGLINLVVRHTSGDSIYVDCPACSVFRKGKLNINFKKSNFRCNRCDASGGMLDLYITFGNANLTRSEARAEIIEKLKMPGAVSSHDTFFQRIVNESVTNAELASIKDIDYTYRTLLSLLPLSEFHTRELMRRGLTKEQIISHNFRSVPHADYIGYCMYQLAQHKCVIKGVPGFYIDNTGRWTMRFSSFCSGIIIPAIGLDGYIHALQIRLDKPFEDGTKYIWFSSVTKEQGVSSGSPVNLAGNPYSEVVYLTEGGLKAAVAHYLSGKTFLGNQGANHLCALRKALETLKVNGTRIIVVAYDNDKYNTLEVNEGYAKIIAMVKEYGFRLELINWDSNYKGIDDFLLAQINRKKQLTGLAKSA